MERVDYLISAHLKLERIDKMLDSSQPNCCRDLSDRDVRLLVREQQRLMEVLGVR